MKIYSVYHSYDIDGGYGDAVCTDEHVATFANKADAKAFVEKYNNPYIYDKPYDELCCNEFFIREMEIITPAEFDINKTPQDYGVYIPERMVECK